MRILVTAGPTREAIDPVRYISNRSSGKMGYAIAAAARRRGHEVCLVSGPVSLRPPRGVRVVAVTSAEEMLAAVRRALPGCHALVMAAAVADWRPRRVSRRKLKKRRMAMVLRLEPTPDILASIRPRKGRRCFIGFAAETGNVVREARRKLTAKGLDLIVANDVSQPGVGFEVDTNRVTLLAPGAAPEEWPLQSKRKVAAGIVRWLEGWRPEPGLSRSARRPG